MNWLLLVISLPTQNASARMRVWRSLKAEGAAVLRDGVYLLPERDDLSAIFHALAQDVEAAEGSAQVLKVLADDQQDFRPLFDRSTDYAELLQELAAAQQQLGSDNLQEAARQLRKLRKNFTAVSAIDFFPGEARSQAGAQLSALELQLSRQLSPTEPQNVEAEIQQRDPQLYRGRRWATRQRPWVDRLASAWLIQRFIDPEASFIWLESPADCPSDALGFDFDGAAFTHIAGRVTFEVLAASFGLAQPALQRLGALVHFLDVGGIQPVEASGLEQILWGLRNSIADDDSLQRAANGVFDALFTAFTNKENS